MKCTDSARLLIGAGPAASTPELEAHLADCPACARFRQEMRIFDADLRRSMQKPPVLGATIEYLPYLDRRGVVRPSMSKVRTLAGADIKTVARLIAFSPCPSVVWFAAAVITEYRS